MDRKEELLERNEKIIEHGLKHVLSTEEGRAWYYDLVGKCGVFRSDTLDRNLIFFEAGKKNLGIMLLAEAENYDPDSFIKMQIEVTNRKKEINNVPSTNTDTSTSSDTKFNALI